MFQDTRPAALGPEGSLDPGADFRVEDGAELLRLLRQLCDGSVPVTLSAPPLRNGLAVARGRVLVALENGSVLCLATQK